jgi:hypothetical protein
MKINKKDLQDALEIVKPGLSNKLIIEQTTSFAFLQDRVVTYNDEISISHPVKDLLLNGAIKAEELFKLLSKIKKDEISIEITNNEIIISSGKAKAGFILETEISLPLLDLSVADWQKLPAKFNQHLLKCIPCCSKDMSRLILTGVYTNLADGYITASDGYRIMKTNIKASKKGTNFLISAMAATEVAKLNPIQFSLDDNWVHFKNEQNTTISCRLINELYPAILPHLEVFGKSITFPESIIDILDRASIMGKQDNLIDELLDIEIQNNQIKINSRSSAGWFEESANIRYKDEVIKFKMTPGLFRTILNEIKTCIISKKVIKFVGEDWEYIGLLRD